jgi:hypothetical protein
MTAFNPEELAALRAAFEELDKHPILLRHEEGDWCDLDPQDDQTVVFYRKSGAPFMRMPYEDWKALRDKGKP